MNSVLPSFSTASPNSLQNFNKPSSLPTEKTKELDNDKVRQSAVSIIETKQKKQLAEQYIQATSNANQSHTSDNSFNLTDAQDIAQFARRVKVVQVIDENDGSKIKDVAENRREKIESFFREMNSPEEQIAGQKIDSLA